MGDVYRAKKLKRRWNVAIEVLMEAFASDPQGLRRFE